MKKFSEYVNEAEIQPDKDILKHIKKGDTIVGVSPKEYITLGSYYHL